MAPGWPRRSRCPPRLKAEEGAAPEQLCMRAPEVPQPHSTTMCPWAGRCQKVTHALKESQGAKKGEPNHLKQSVHSALCPRDTPWALQQDAVQPSGPALHPHRLRQHRAVLSLSILCVHTGDRDGLSWGRAERPQCSWSPLPGHLRVPA